MNRYPSYKKTGIRWLSHCPSHWDIVPSKRIFENPKEKNMGRKEKNVLSLTLKGVLRNDPDNPIGLAPADYSSYQIFEKDDLVFKLIDLENASTSRVGLVPERGIMSSAYIRFSLRNSSDEIRYFYYQYYDLWQRLVFNGLGAGVRQTLSADDLGLLKIIIPPQAEQRKIVAYIDWKTSEINRLINGYQKQIRLLDEYTLALIDSCVTNGIRNSQKKRVQSNWVSEIPCNWSFDKVKQHFEIRKRIAGKEGYDVISITQQGLKVKNISSNEGQMALDYSKYQFVYPDEFAMNHMDLLTGYIGLSEVFGVTSPDYRVFAALCPDKLNLKYFLYVFQLGYKRKIFYGLGRGAANKGRWRLPAQNFLNYEIPIPPKGEQDEIVEFLDKKLTLTAQAKTSFEKRVNLLKEYKTALISNVVTGQVDVRDVEIPEFETVELTDTDSDVEAEVEG